MTCKCKGTGRRDGFSEYLDCMEPGCNAAVERAKFNKRLKEAGSMSVEDAAWWGRMDAQAKRPAHGHREDYYLLANARRIAVMPIHQGVRMPNWVLAMELFATGSTSACKICRDAGIDPDAVTIERR